MNNSITIPIAKVAASMINAASVPAMETTKPPNAEPNAKDVDHEADPSVLAVTNSFSATILGNAAISAVM